MAERRLYEHQPRDFAFSPENLRWAEAEIRKYPEGRQASAVIPLLWRAQEQEGWLTEPAIRAVADMLGMAHIRVLEVATFYTMFHLARVGRVAHLQVCGTTPCWLRGSDALFEVCRTRIAPHAHELSADGAFSWEEMECLGACVNAPLVQIGADTFEDLTAERLGAILDDLAAGRPVQPGSQIARHSSEPEGGATTLNTPGLYGDRSTEPTTAGPPLTDTAAKRPGTAANQRDAPVPKPPAADNPAERRP